MRLKVDTNKSLERDPETNAILNTNKEAYNIALLRKKNRNKSNNDIKRLENEISELKDLLKTLISGLNK